MPTLDENHTGARIREQRRLARLAQRRLAARLPYSLIVRSEASPKSTTNHAHPSSPERSSCLPVPGQSITLQKHVRLR
ncbi:hypothetical protein [Streptomyces sp. NBC_00986]|uniref:hypothetical protein n=1 Tax=Streptomyces sp. NBC_00986 TaxID=2903702 RepID=UPI00386713E2|nr:hypothetical protein OG504_17975 [Streptomyces sp. NBC_00986]